MVVLARLVQTPFHHARVRFLAQIVWMLQTIPDDIEKHRRRALLFFHDPRFRQLVFAKSFVAQRDLMRRQRTMGTTKQQFQRFRVLATLQPRRPDIVAGVVQHLPGRIRRRHRRHLLDLREHPLHRRNVRKNAESDQPPEQGVQNALDIHLLLRDRQRLAPVRQTIEHPLVTAARLRRERVREKVMIRRQKRLLAPRSLQKTELVVLATLPRVEKRLVASQCFDRLPVLTANEHRVQREDGTKHAFKLFGFKDRRPVLLLVVAGVKRVQLRLDGRQTGILQRQAKPFGERFDNVGRRHDLPVFDFGQIRHRANPVGHALLRPVACKARLAQQHRQIQAIVLHKNPRQPPGPNMARSPFSSRSP